MAILADIYWAGSLLPKIIMIPFTQSAAILHKYSIVLKLFYLLYFFPEVAQNSENSLRFPSSDNSLSIPRFHVSPGLWPPWPLVAILGTFTQHMFNQQVNSPQFLCLWPTEFRNLSARGWMTAASDCLAAARSWQTNKLITAFTVVQAAVKANSQSNWNGQISTITAPKTLNRFRWHLECITMSQAWLHTQIHVLLR